MERQIGQKLEQVPKEQLDGILQSFFAEIHQNDGKTMEQTLKNHHSFIY